ncbi:MAG: ABC transporter ATP-binding protein [Nitrospirae bacterium]|nr:ABC transporter ATP-binding protein [Candidatus Manganitrophaceae bacterium]
MLSIEDLHASYGPVSILKGISLQVEAGEVVALIGANGAGKTTTLMAISGLVPNRSGRITFCGEEVSALPPHRIVERGICQVPEGRRIFPRLSIQENLEMGAYLQVDPNIVAEDLRQVFALFPVLKERRFQRGGTLSGGEQQMLAIGRALMSRPKLLLLDEPSLGLSPLMAEKIFEMIKEIRRQGKTILLVEQNAHAALKLADRGYVMETGQIVLTDQALHLLENPRVQSAYLGGGPSH